MPDSISLFVKVAYAALVLGAVSMAINGTAAGKSLIYLAVSWAIQAGVQILFIRWIAQRKNWARLVFVALTFLVAAFAIYLVFLGKFKGSGIVGDAVLGLVYLTSLVSAVLLLTADSRAWFRREADNTAGAFE